MSVTGSASSTDNLKVLKGKIASLAPYAVDPSLSVEGAAADAKAVGDALEKKLDNADVVDNLTTSDSKKALSAKQGVTLKKSVDDLRVNTEESIGNIEQTLTEQGVNLKNAQDSAENAITNAENAQTTADKKIDPDGSVAMTADFDMGSHNIVNLAEPVEETDAATKKFVEDAVKVKTVSATLKATDWYSTTDAAPYLQEITVEGLTDGVKAKVWAVFKGDSATDNPVMEACACVNTCVRGDGEIIFTCFKMRPDTDITVMVELYSGDTEDGESIPMIGFGSGGLSMELLWENASPDSDFAEQTLSFSWGKATHYIVEFVLSTSGSNGASTGIVKLYNQARLMFVTHGSSAAGGCYRDFYSYEKKFTNAKQIASDSKANFGCIPVRIYGIKGVT